ncbi:hypothetical protein K443DRAFT_125056 [Laccaria amethystina LaAM-08-1]|uniref:Unplaced genomic scaffold K443scaffold_241, whole genome shotgun sequence n=1 Tax=Laccaria amethystina LaAM-08-1 TaxID=1095629 RepID=A0A0C9WJK4_9AGAR|nr:hypothetical protein K443DRAFT_125056 [Laccaria amethystina LaAM-08-1]
MSLSARRSCTIPKPKSSNPASPNKTTTFTPSYDTQYVKRFLGFWKQGKSDRKACQAFVKLHSTCERHACKAKPRSCVVYKDGISCTTCQNMGRKCPRLQGFLLDYVAVHLGVSSRTALDLYGRYVRRQPEPPKGSVTDEEDSDSDSSEDFTEELLSDDLDVLEITSEDEGHSEEERAKKRREDNELVNSQAAAAAAAQLSTVKKRIDELEARLAQTKKENAELLEREKRYALKAAAAENQRLQPPSQEVMEKALEAEMLKRKEVYRKELLEEWDRVHQRESGRLHEHNDDMGASTCIVVPRSSVSLHAAITGFVETMGLDETTSRVLDLLQWVTELSNVVHDMDAERKMLGLACPNGAPQKRAINGENLETLGKRRRVEEHEQAELAM